MYTIKGECLSSNITAWLLSCGSTVAIVSFRFLFSITSTSYFLIAFDKQLDQSCLGFRRQKPSRIKARNASSNVWNVHHLYTSCNSRAANALSQFLAVTAVVTGQVWQLVSISGVSTGMVSDRPPLDRLAAPYFTPYMPCRSVATCRYL